MKSWACKNFKASDSDPAFCANCGDLASMHKGPTPGAPRQFVIQKNKRRLPANTPADELAYLESIISTGQTSSQLPTNHKP
jgi:hypothetical protein